jgi:uncharacterized protein (TIGR00255 family)
MTGFGAARAKASGPGGGTVQVFVEIRSVNHRFSDVRVRAPADAPDVAGAVEQFARARLGRGRHDVTVRLEGAPPPLLDRARARAAYASLCALRDELVPSADVPLSLLVAVPGLFTCLPTLDAGPMMSALEEAFEDARSHLHAMRVREGIALAADLLGRAATVRVELVSFTERAPDVTVAYERRLRDRAERLRAATGGDVPPGRLEQEIALVADRCDVSEEITRLASHLTQFEDLCRSSEAIGRRLDFLIQEMSREVNTLGAKCNDLQLSRGVLLFKAELERMREQVQNVE